VVRRKRFEFRKFYYFGSFPFFKFPFLELIPGGADIDVTDENKHDYISKLVQWHLTDGIKPQINGLVYGFNEVVNVKHLNKFSSSDLELALCGTQEVDLEDWRTNTEYRGGYYDSHDTVKLFWEYIAR